MDQVAPDPRRSRTERVKTLRVFTPRRALYTQRLPKSSLGIRKTWSGPVDSLGGRGVGGQLFRRPDGTFDQFAAAVGARGVQLRCASGAKRAFEAAYPRLGFGRQVRVAAFAVGTQLEHGGFVLREADPSTTSWSPSPSADGEETFSSLREAWGGDHEVVEGYLVEGYLTYCSWGQRANAAPGFIRRAATRKESLRRTNTYHPWAKAKPSSAQPVMPPIITFTLRPRRASFSAAWSAPLQWGPAQ